jgi:hypothetical protein
MKCYKNIKSISQKLRGELDQELQSLGIYKHNNY